MIEVLLPKQNLNPELLHEALSAILGAKYISSDTSDAGIFIRLTDNVTAADRQAVKDYLQSHDMNAISAAESEREAAREALARLKAWDLDTLRATTDLPTLAGVIADMLLCLKVWLHD